MPKSEILIPWFGVEPYVFGIITTKVESDKHLETERAPHTLNPLSVQCIVLHLCLPDRHVTDPKGNHAVFL